MFQHISTYMNPNMIQKDVGNYYYWHYAKYLSQLTFQLFEWENLPKTVDPRYLEMMLHTHGYVGFYRDKELSYMAVNGTAGTHINRYLQPTKFTTATPDYENRQFEIYNFGDNLELMDKDKTGVVIWNNDMHVPTMDSVIMFAKKLANAMEIIDINLNAQKTPVLITAEDTNKFSLMNVYNQYEGNAPVIVANKHFDPNSIKVFKTEAPFVVDKINDQKNAYWSEFLTFLGIRNIAIDKKERLTTSEADSGEEKEDASRNIMLKSRLEARDRIVQLYPELEGLNVKMRTDILQLYMENDGFETNLLEDGDEVGNV
ncbi:upper collar connector [Bacillus phage DLc1]|uniref:Upper collar protein n=1 Tax=Bacillus phage DLc1 TaxID=2777318 RepID=A0A7M1RQ82_9CAUD|nr:upper collar connector [Bacillus phage DLc1]QOR56284.1 upper collar protein [Bacillus phage DLc1]